LGHALSRIIHAFAESEHTPNAKIFMAKWDVKDGFWIKLVVPTSPQMGWVESPPYFCAASETARDVAMDYVGVYIVMVG
jgi:hypothetical protein